MSPPIPPHGPVRIDRRVAIKWMLTAGAGAMLVNVRAFGETPAAPAVPGQSGYGTDPDLMKAYKAGDYWPLTFSAPQRRTVAALCDVVLPADEVSPSASGVGVTDFMDEWVSAPYPANVTDRALIVGGLAWLDAESARRFGSGFADATDAQRVSLCESIAYDAPATGDPKPGSAFFKRFRNLTAAGFYTTPIGMKDLGYVGNVVLARFDGPPADLIAKMGLQDEVAW
jgi:hypothetical protein